MTKTELRKLLVKHDDCIITYRSLNSNKLKYNVCTLDFSCEHIKKKTNKTKESTETLLTFCWDTDTFRLIRPSQVTSIVPLSKVLN